MSDNPSQHEANKMLRVLNGQKLKYTVRVTFLDGRILEFQVGKPPTIKWREETRSVWIWGYAGADNSYEGYPISEWTAGSVLQCEENPE